VYNAGGGGMTIPIFDAHLDLAWSAVFFNRDLTKSVEEVRRREQGMTDEPGRGRGTVTFPELRRARVGVCVATLLARGGPEQKVPAGYKRSDLDYVNQDVAHCAAQAQLTYYRLMEARGQVRMLRTARELEAHWRAYRAKPDDTRLGVILSMEGADPVVTPDQLDEWWRLGLRAIGPAHYGRGHYAYGTATDGPLGERGVELLRRMERLGIILDATHLSDTSMAEALDVFGGPILASHHNCRALVPGDRQLTDEQIRRLVGRGAVIGVALDAWMLYPGWDRGKTSPQVVGLDAAADHIDHVSQLAGSARHSGVGSDLDGGFGTEQTPRDLDTIADLQKLTEILDRRGYAREDIDGIFHGNWLRFFTKALPHE
jgi:membrane dipeptidase